MNSTWIKKEVTCKFLAYEPKIYISLFNVTKFLACEPKIYISLFNVTLSIDI